MEELFSLWLRINDRLQEVEMSEADVDALELQISRVRARKRSRESAREIAAGVLEVR